MAQATATTKKRNSQALAGETPAGALKFVLVQWEDDSVGVMPMTVVKGKPFVGAMVDIRWKGKDIRSRNFKNL